MVLPKISATLTCIVSGSQRAGTSITSAHRATRCTYLATFLWILRLWLPCFGSMVLFKVANCSRQTTPGPQAGKCSEAAHTEPKSSDLRVEQQFGSRSESLWDFLERDFKNNLLPFFCRFFGGGGRQREDTKNHSPPQNRPVFAKI